MHVLGMKTDNLDEFKLSNEKLFSFILGRN